MDYADALQSLSGSKNPVIAALAAEILAEENPQDTINKQAALIASLKAQVSALQERLQQREVPMTAQQLDDLRDFMQQRLSSMPVAIMRSTFDETYFVALEQAAREVVAEAIVDECVSRNARPQTLWSMLVTQRGAM